ncbi:hypothetical protein [Nocardia coffeae]|uniref:hypothetical protein n=1 Tax=Nocardia coffeae TaxID=2873381 RepID=UPI001F1BD9FB|nr:hypothetical protein [Nocardia coffeae]
MLIGVQLCPGIEFQVGCWETQFATALVAANDTASNDSNIGLLRGVRRSIPDGSHQDSRTTVPNVAARIGHNRILLIFVG